MLGFVVLGRGWVFGLYRLGLGKIGALGSLVCEFLVLVM